MKRRELIKGTAASIFAALTNVVPGIQATDPSALPLANPDELPQLKNGDVVWELITSIETKAFKGPDGNVVSVWRSPYVKVELCKRYRTNDLDPAVFKNIGKVVQVDPPGFVQIAPNRNWLGIGPSLEQLEVDDENPYRWEVVEIFLLSPEGGWGPLYETGFLDTSLAIPWEGTP